ncbi:MAG: PhnA protein, partial [Pedobacter sp.]
MKLEQILTERSGGACELCGAKSLLNIYEVPPQDNSNEDNSIFICSKCLAQVDKKEELYSPHWQAALPGSMWNEVPGVQVVAWRMLNRLRNESWASDNLDMMYLDDERLAWAKKSGDHENDGSVDLHKDCNGAQLINGDSVV